MEATLFIDVKNIVTQSELRKRKLDQICLIQACCLAVIAAARQ